MAEIQATASHEQARRLQAAGAVRATVNGRQAIVTANTWDPVTPDPEVPPHYVKAREIVNVGSDVEAQGTPAASSEIQELVDAVNWEPWPS